MMEYQNQLKLQSYLDGELTEAAASEVVSLLARDPEAVALLAELLQTSETLLGFEDGIRLPESRDFFWSKIQREIKGQQGLAPERASSVPWSARLRRLLMPATGFAVVALLALVVTRESASRSSESSAETALGDSGAFTYHDDTAGATLVWLSYPAENELADNDDLNSLD